MTFRMSWRPVVAGAGVGALLGYAALYRLGKVSGSTKQERARALPGDDLIKSPSLVTNHAAPSTPRPSRCGRG